MPIKDSAGDVIGVAQVINKMNGECFSEIDEKVSGSEWKQWGGGQMRKRTNGAMWRSHDGAV